MTSTTGKVYLIGAGPGDPGLLTVKGREALERADVVVYDRLAHPSLLDHAPPTAERVFAGKARGQQELTQDGINNLLVERAQTGLRVARLKGGDPFVFGRGGEEALALARNGIPFEVVPGVSSAIAAPAYAGIPVTHRGIATGFTVVSGSEDPSKPVSPDGSSGVRWEELGRSLAAHGGTLMTLMGWASIEKILDALQRAGLPSDTPVALVQWGTWSRQKTVTGTLETAAAKGRDAGLAAPVVAIIGHVVSLREELAWFDNRPLFARRVLVTRSRTQASRMCQLLEDAGAVAVELPAIAIVPPEDFALLDDAVSRLSSYGWVIFASVNAVESVFERLDAQGRDARAFGAARVGAIGPATAEALERRGIRPDFVPSRSVSVSGAGWNCPPMIGTVCPPSYLLLTSAATNWPTGCPVLAPAWSESPPTAPSRLPMRRSGRGMPSPRVSTSSLSRARPPSGTCCPCWKKRVVRANPPWLEASSPASDR